MNKDLELEIETIKSFVKEVMEENDMSYTIDVDYKNVRVTIKINNGWVKEANYYINVDDENYEDDFQEWVEEVEKIDQALSRLY